MKNTEIKTGIGEVLNQCRYAEIAYKNGNDFSNTSVETIFYSLHSFLTHCAMVSKILWSKDLEKNIENKLLADILLIPETSKIKSRHFRNILEHYDEYLKKAMDVKGPNFNFVDNNIGNKNSIIYEQAKTIRMRHYDPATKIYTLIDEDINLDQMYRDILSIKEKTEQWLKN